MEFRPCIDIHNGAVKQIVGSSLTDEGDYAKENFVSNQDSTYYAGLYKKYNLKGGHVILLNAKDSEYYEDTKECAKRALKEYPNALQVGGGINADNAKEFIEAGASHVIVTSFVFDQGKILYDNLNRLIEAVGKEHIVLDLSCRRRENDYFVVTNRWQTFTDIKFEKELFDKLSGFCDEFLVHAVDVEGKNSGIDINVLRILAQCDMPVTYAGGVSSIEDIITIRNEGKGKVNVTVGSKLALFGGNMAIEEILECIR